MIGKVVSVGTKTVIVEVAHAYRHPLYKKSVNRIKRIAVHNEKEGIKTGDIVTVAETRPVSKTKHFKII